MSEIIVEDLKKTFRLYSKSTALGRPVMVRSRKNVEALKGVSFRIDRGELVGYIGPNGAGKSTTIKILSGILVPDSGSATVGGLVPWKHRIRHVSKIGVVFGQRTQLWWDLPVLESYKLLRHIYRVPPDEYEKTFDELVALLDLTKLLEVPVRQLSLGQRMRCDIAASLVHSPEVLFLDEPTIGLDASVKLAVREFILRINSEKKVTVILTTHDMDDIEALCRRVMVIGNGSILSDGTIRELREQVSPERRLTIDFEGEPPTSLPNVRILRSEGNRVVFAYDPAVIATESLIGLIAKSYRIRDLVVEHPPIEEIVADYYNELDNAP